jgi:hypothetical protein
VPGGLRWGLETSSRSLTSSLAAFLLCERLERRPLLLLVVVVVLLLLPVVDLALALLRQ